MVTVEKILRKSRVLTSSSLACLSRIPTINLTTGCAHACVYCYTRGYRTHPGEGRIGLYSNTLEKLKEELARKRKKPKRVYFSPSSDLFQPVPEVLDLAYDVLAFLLGAGVAVAFLTKGRIPDRHFELLQSCPGRVRAQIGITTLDRATTAAFEPHAATPAVRMRQIERLVACGIPTRARLDPMLPGVTDDVRTLGELCGALARAGITTVAASMLFLRPAVIHSLRRHMVDTVLVDRLLSQFDVRDRLAIHAEQSSVIALPQCARRESYERLEEIARRHGISVRCCACKNPDLPAQSCSIAGDSLREAPAPKQTRLFQ